MLSRLATNSNAHRAVSLLSSKNTSSMSYGVTQRLLSGPPWTKGSSLALSLAPQLPRRTLFTFIQQHQLGVTEIFGQYKSTKEPGIRLCVPGVHRIMKVDMRTIVLELGPQNVFIKDNVPINANAIVFFRVISAKNAMYKVENARDAIRELVQGKLIDILSDSEVSDVLYKRRAICHNIYSGIYETAKGWGIGISGIWLKDIKLAESLVRVMDKKAEAKLSRTLANVELETAFALRAAGEEFSRIGMELRELNTQSEIAKEPSSITSVPTNVTFKP